MRTAPYVARRLLTLMKEFLQVLRRFVPPYKKYLVLTIVFNIRINDILGIVFSPLAMAVNTPLGYGIYHALCGLVFFCGINSAVVIGVVQPFIMQMGAANEAAYLAGEALPYSVTYATDSMIWAGGTGMTIGLVILMCFMARSAQYKTIGRMSVVPAIFNLNEPVIFGTPICFNPIFFIPFVFCPGLSGLFLKPACSRLHMRRCCNSSYQYFYIPASLMQLDILTSSHFTPLLHGFRLSDAMSPQNLPVS